MKKVLSLVSIGLLLMAQSASYGIDASFTLVGATITNLIPVGCRVYSLQILNNSTIATPFGIVDGPSTNGLSAGIVGTGTSLLVYSNASYFTTLQVITNITRIVTNFAGITNLNITVESNALQTVTNTVAPLTNSYRTVLGGTMAAGPATLFTVTNVMNFTLGVTITNAALGTNIYNITYSPNL